MTGQVHPIRQVCNQRGLTYKQFAAIVRDAVGSNSPKANLIAHYVAGTKIPGRNMADSIHRAFPEITRESLIYYHRETVP